MNVAATKPAKFAGDAPTSSRSLAQSRPKPNATSASLSASPFQSALRGFAARETPTARCRVLRPPGQCRSHYSYRAATVSSRDDGPPPGGRGVHYDFARVGVYSRSRRGDGVPVIARPPASTRIEVTIRPALSHRARCQRSPEAQGAPETSIDSISDVGYRLPKHSPPSACEKPSRASSVSHAMIQARPSPAPDSKQCELVAGPTPKPARRPANPLFSSRNTRRPSSPSSSSKIGDSSDSRIYRNGFVSRHPQESWMDEECARWIVATLPRTVQADPPSARQSSRTKPRPGQIRETGGLLE